jgi:hypothetical protein
MHKSLLFILALAIPAAAQFSGRLSGTVTDGSGAPVASATVNLNLPGGTKPLLTTSSGTDGVWRFIGVRPTEYDITFDAPGFAQSVLHNVPVDPARENDLPPVVLQVSAVSQSIDVTAEVQTATVETSDAITAEQIQKLPTLDRDPLGLIQTLPGVVNNGNTPTTIDGLRTSYSNMTLDGINIQDNYLRDNALDYTPNRVLLGQIRQFTLVSSNANSAAPGGATQLAFETPSGTNTFHGEVLWRNRNSAFAANDWFNNQSGVGRPRLNENQGSASVGGPIKKDKLFFFADYELVRLNQQMPQISTILTDAARTGVFTYVDTSGITRQANVLSLRNKQIDPYMQTLLAKVPVGSAANSFAVGDSATGALRNTIGYRFNQRSNETRDSITSRVDYNLSPKHVFFTSFIWNRDNDDSPDSNNPTYSVVPAVVILSHSWFLSSGWRWTPTATLTNELRGGFNLAPGDFMNSQPFGAFQVLGTLFSDPLSEFFPQGRATNTWSISDNASWQKGRHFIQFGFHEQQIRVHAYDDSGIVPSYTLAMGTGQPALGRTDLPGIRSTDLATANALLATLGGYIDSYSQTFNVTSPTSKFVNGAGNVRDLRLGETDFYAQDVWKLHPRLTATLGLRWNIPGVANEVNSLELSPIVQNGDPVKTLLSNATLDFIGNSVGRPWYSRSWRDFAPNVGLAWDVHGDGKMAIRAGYSIAYVNDQGIVAPQSILEANSGLIGLSEAGGLSSQISNNRPVIAAPPYQVPVTVAENYKTNPFNTVGLLEPNLHTPYVQQWSLSVQREFRHTVFEARYAGNHLVHGYRAFDYNQVDITSNGFLPDFLRAQNNGLLSYNLTKIFNPVYNPTIPGSQPLPVFAQLSGGGNLNRSSIRNLIQRGEVGALAATYQENGLNGSVNFFQNPNALGADILANYSTSSYEALQLVVTHRTRNGLQFSGNYSFSKVLADTAGDSQSRVEQFLDVNNPGLERSRATFDLRHSIKATGTYDLPFGSGHRLHYRPLNRLIGGWSFGSILSWQSGAPFSILSELGTLNRADNFRSYYNTADTSLNYQQLTNIVGFQMTGNGPLIIAPSAINPSDHTGTNGVGVAGVPAPFAGQVFYNPTAGTLGTLQRRLFSGPWSFDLDASIQKNIRITERQSLELRMEGQNIFNHPTFWTGDQNINDTTFGVISNTLNFPRLMQFGLKYSF